MSWSVIQVPTEAHCSNFINSWKSQSNSIKFFWISNPTASMIFYSNSILNFEKLGKLFLILKYSNPYFIWFFFAGEDYFEIESNWLPLKRKSKIISYWARPKPDGRHRPITRRASAEVGRPGLASASARLAARVSTRGAEVCGLESAHYYSHVFPFSNSMFV
jgi:hypothetical protein